MLVEVDFEYLKLKLGMKVKCFKCGKPILLTRETFTFDHIAEYVKCPECGDKRDVHAYMLHGEEIKD